MRYVERPLAHERNPRSRRCQLHRGIRRGSSRLPSRSCDQVVPSLKHARCMTILIVIVNRHAAWPSRTHRGVPRSTATTLRAHRSQQPAGMSPRAKGAIQTTPRSRCTCRRRGAQQTGVWGARGCRLRRSISTQAPRLVTVIKVSNFCNSSSHFLTRAFSSVSLVSGFQISERYQRVR